MLVEDVSSPPDNFQITLLREVSFSTYGGRVWSMTTPSLHKIDVYFTTL